MSRFAFERHGAEVAEGGVQALAIVPSFDVLEDGGASLGSGGKGVIGTFSLEGGEKAFRDGIVIAVADPAHTDLALKGGQALLVESASVLATLIGMMQQLG